MTLLELPADTKQAQTHVVNLPVSGLKGLSGWAYLALGFVIISIIALLYYFAHHVYRALTLGQDGLPQYVKPLKKKTWFSGKQQSGQRELLLQASVDTDSTQRLTMNNPFDIEKQPLALPPVVAHAVPTEFTRPARSSRPLQQTDANLAAAPPPAIMSIYADVNTKLSPVSAAPVALSRAETKDSGAYLVSDPPPSKKNLKKCKSESSLMTKLFRVKRKNKMSGSTKENFQLLDGSNV
ncbi:unnamed protein product [Mycena citricolor]|uniref:Uncharacterized protein n=1 Tax=Mycena citricolor TaxID=2018698 RepID=A0AAD2HHY8_9AGAR|nr:unnamed protein product [Mycena citricolor]